jgi:exonuclease SbcC
MRPIKLTMSAFGPYAEETVLNMEKLGTSGIYLIAGNTGSGKTTIFDAITYALYGDASGNVRDVTMLRSEHADPKIKTFVEMVFDYGGRRYKVKRTFAYDRPKLRGEGTVEEKAGAELTYPDGKVITDVRMVNSALIDIIGIDRSQFSRIAMIAQGDFMKIVASDTKDRKKIFREIFHTEKYRDLQQYLKDRASDFKGQCKTAYESIEEYKGNIILEKDAGDQASRELERAIEEGLMTEELIGILSESLISDRVRLEELNKNREDINKKLTRITEILTVNEQRQRFLNSLRSSETSLVAAGEELKRAKDEKDAAERKKPEIKTLSDKVHAIKAELPNYKIMEGKKNLIVEINRSISGQKDSLSAYKENIDRVKKAIALSKETIAGSEKFTEEKAELEKEKLKLESEMDKLLDLAKVIGESDEAYRMMIRAKEAYIRENRNFIRLQDEYESKRFAYIEEQAGIMADELVPGEPCPVCGSKDHPNPAVKGGDAPSKEELEKKRLEYRKADQTMTEAGNRAASAKTLYDEKNKIKGEKIELIFNDNVPEDPIKALSEKKESLNGRLKEIGERLEKIGKKIKDVKTCRAELGEQEEKLESLNNDMNMTKTRLAADLTRLEETKNSIEILESRLTFTGEHEAEEEIRKLDKSIASIEKDIEDAGEKYAECDKKIVILNAAIEEAKNNLSGSQEIDRKAVEEEKNILSAMNRKTFEKISELSLRIGTNDNVLVKLKDKVEMLADLEKKYAACKNLSDTANGSLSGKEKIMFETYVQMTYFDRIIARANKRLLVMSSGQYELVRRKEAFNNISQSGLELDVIDRYNGTERSVKTLSGGESFKASLALALGLSDEIQESAGGIRLDTMFVDEGFGSLDEESLRQAMKALADLTEGDRLVGIISHVESLKSRIDKQIVVEKDFTGKSHVEIKV